MTKNNQELAKLTRKWPTRNKQPTKKGKKTVKKRPKTTKSDQNRNKTYKSTAQKCPNWPKTTKTDHQKAKTDPKMTNNNQKKDENQTKSYKTNKNHQTTKQPKLAKEERSFDSERPKKKQPKLTEKKKPKLVWVWSPWYPVSTNGFYTPAWCPNRGLGPVFDMKVLQTLRRVASSPDFSPVLPQQHPTGRGGGLLAQPACFVGSSKKILDVESNQPSLESPLAHYLQPAIGHQIWTRCIELLFRNLPGPSTSWLWSSDPLPPSRWIHPLRLHQGGLRPPPSPLTNPTTNFTKLQELHQ